MEVNITALKVEVINSGENDTLEVNLEADGHEFYMKFNLTFRTWSMVNFSHNDNPFRIMGGSNIQGSYSGAFGCADFHLTNLTDRITFYKLQLEPFFNFTSQNYTPILNETVYKLTNFSYNVYDCKGPLSPGAAGGIFVTLFFMVILAIGISMILDIRTTDRFEDSKGKPLNIIAQE